MRLIPVIDVLNGIVVRAVAGRRSDYRPLVSRLTNSVEPLEVARALLAVTGAQELYVADLDAIRGEPSAVRPTHFPITVLFDAGLRSMEQLEDVNRLPNVRAIIGSETWTVPPEAWPQPFPGILSLDLFERQMRCAWGQAPGIDELLSSGIASVIVLDLARVGTGSGSGTESLIRTIRKRRPRIELIAGGGVKSQDDLARLEDVGADAVLVASALHDGSLGGTR